MKLSEITKDEFVDKLKDPALFAFKKHFSEYEAELKDIGWNVELKQHTDDSYIVLAHRQEANPFASSVEEARDLAYVHFIESDMDEGYGIRVISQNQTPDVYQVVLGWW